MDNYNGEEILKIGDSVFAKYRPDDWIMYYIEQYGQIDGDHHKVWLLDQIVRILKGTPITLKKASWGTPVTHTEYRVDLSAETSEEYKQWVINYCDGEDGPNTYGYDEGIAP